MAIGQLIQAELVMSLRRVADRSKADLDRVPASRAQRRHFLTCERRKMPLVEKVMVYRRNLDHHIAAVDGSDWLKRCAKPVMAMVLTALKGMISVMAGAACCQRTPNDQSKQEECHEKKSLA
jgi:hypothetical protein